MWDYTRQERSWSRALLPQLRRQMDFTRRSLFVEIARRASIQ